MARLGEMREGVYITCCASMSSTDKLVKFPGGEGTIPAGIRWDRPTSVDDLLLAVEYILRFPVEVRYRKFDARRLGKKRCGEQARQHLRQVHTNIISGVWSFLAALATFIVEINVSNWVGNYKEHMKFMLIARPNLPRTILGSSSMIHKP